MLPRSPLPPLRAALLALALAACGEDRTRPGGVGDVPPPQDVLDAPPVDAPPVDAPRDTATALDARTDAPPVDAPSRCVLDAQCDDGLACTEDRCVAGGCVNEPSAARCPAGSACDPARGCLPPRGCINDPDCADADPCSLEDRCDRDLRVCVFQELASGTPCGGGRVCRGGRCACPATRPLACGDLCVSPLSDPDHCGACGVSCGAGAWCRDGRCQCSSPQTHCPGVGCVDTTADTAHCGGCGRPCATSDAGTVSCAAGRCVLPCAPGTHRCGADCVRDDAVATCATSCTPCPEPSHGRAICTLTGCTIACDAGYHPCGTECLSNTSVLSCGTACGPCPTPDRGRVDCVDGTCRGSCDPGYHVCGTRCLEDTSVLSCGTACAPCPAPEHGAASCASGRCDFTCDAGYRRCGDACSDGTSPLGCGPDCVRCSAPEHGVATCAAARCGFRCDPGYHACGGACLLDTSTASCGTSCEPCPEPEHGRANCVAGACGFVCEYGYARDGARCVEQPRPLWPPSGAHVTTRRPALRWRLPADLTDAVVELCRDRACADVIEALPAVGGTARPASALGSAAVFWRVRAREGGRAGPTWTFAADGTREEGGAAAAWGALPDVDGDGYGDVIASVPYLSPRGRVYIHRGTPAGVASMASVALNAQELDTQFGFSVSAVGDLNGDGYGDLAVSAPAALRGEGVVYLYHGRAEGPEDLPYAELRALDRGEALFGTCVASAGDVNGDGFGDLIVGAPRALGSGRAYVFLGGGRGLGDGLPVTLTGAGTEGARTGISVAGAGDIDGDGYSDVLVGADGVASFTGRVYLYRGAAGGVTDRPSRTLQHPSGGQFGVSVSGAGDVTGDGYPDVMVGAQSVETGTGRAYLYAGGAGGLSDEPVSSLTGPAGRDGDFGATTAGVGDVDGDGFSDVVVGAPRVEMFQGEAYFYRGGAAGLASTPTVTLRASSPGGLFGGALGVARDVDRDGYADVVLSAERESGFLGRVYLYRGSATGLAATPVVISNPDATFGRYGFSVAWHSARVCLPGG